MKVPRDRKTDKPQRPKPRPDMPLSPQVNRPRPTPQPNASSSSGSSSSARSGSGSGWLSEAVAGGGVSAPEPEPMPAAAPEPTERPFEWQPALIGATLTLSSVAILLVLVMLLVNWRGSGGGPSTAVADQSPRNTADMTPVAADPRPAATPTPTPTPRPAATPAPRPAAQPQLAPRAAAPNDPDNPFTMNRPNVIGLPARARTAVVVDAIAKSKPWLNDVNAALRAGLARPGGGATVRVFYLSDRKVHTTSDQFTATGRAFSDTLTETQQKIKPAGTSGFWTSFDAALASGADRVILITGRTKWAPVLEMMRNKINGSPRKPSLSVVNLDASVPDLKKFVSEMRGDYESISTQQLERWRQQANR